MSFWSNLLFILQILSAMAMIGLVLIQHGKGADMGASFGSGASGSLFGATGSANFLSRSTAVCATIFFASTLGMSMLSSGRVPVSGPSVNPLDAAAQAVVASAPVTASAPMAAGSAAASAVVVVPASTPASAVQGVPTR